MLELLRLVVQLLEFLLREMQLLQLNCRQLEQ
nr:MAG TPA: hypothetical protein [Caudoviricetes sp.]